MSSGTRLFQGAEGLVVEVYRAGVIALPLRGIARLELDVAASGTFQVTAITGSGEGPPPFLGPPWRHQTVLPGRSTLEFDLLSTVEWRADQQVMLLVVGSGRLELTGLRAARAPVGAELVEAVDRAWRWAPESPGHTTVNFLTPPFWRVTDDTRVPDLLVPAGLAALVAALAAWRALKGAWRPGLALAVAAVLVAAASDAHFLVRFLPVAADVAPRLDPDLRVRDHYRIAPHVGALSALARAALPETARVGVLGAQQDWFGPQTICFNLFPRPCVRLKPGDEEGRGISDVGRLRLSELDALVVIDPERPPPPGFRRVASVSATAYLARRP